MPKNIAITLIALLIFVTTAIADQLGLDYPHNATNSINCWSCHYNTSNPANWATHVPQDIDDTPWNNLCWSCHNDVDAEYVLTHSSLNASDQYGDWTLECKTCHWVHHQNQLRTYGAASYVYTATTAAVNVTTVTRSGGSAWEEDEYEGYIVVPNINQVSYNYIIVSNTEDTLTVEGPIDLTKVTAGIDTMAIIYGNLIKNQIVTPNSGTKTVRFFNNTGTNSFADGDSTYDGVCEVCHTQPDHFRNDGNAPDQLHDNLGGKAGEDCIDCHEHTGFGHGGGGGAGCEECHGHDGGYGGATGGKGTYASHSTHTENDVDDLKGPNIDCADCHDTSNFPYFKSGTDGDGDGRYSLSETDVCDTCHSPGGTYGGANLMDTAVGAKAIWSTGAYVATDDSTLRSGKEKWCATCHDEVPSVIQGVTAPNVIGDEDDSSYTYGGIAPGWGYYKTGHGLPNDQTYASSGGLIYGAGKNCDDCHDYSTAHIDGDARTYSSGSDNYQAGYRLKSVDGEKPMNVPHPQNIDHLDPDNYRLCLSCHDSNRYLLTAPSLVTTSFRDDLDLGPWDGGEPPINIHRYHLQFNSTFFDSDWTGGGDSCVACVNCHNVHGSTQLSMIRDGKLTGREPGMEMYYDDVLVAPDVADPGIPNPDATLVASTGTLFWGPSPGNICGHCHGGEYVKYYRSPPAAPAAPTLDWTGEANYTTDGVDPNSGQGGNYFTFRVKYSDANYQIPRTIQVWIDEDDNGSYEAGEKYDIYEVDSNDIDVSDGKFYRVIRQVNYGGDGTLTYRFYASDGALDATGDPTHATNNTLTVANNAPVLSWTGENGYIVDGINPNSGSVGDTFTFRVKYTDVDGNAPTSIKVWVDKDDDGTSVGDEGAELITMEQANSGDTDYTDGKLYTKDVTISAAGDGTLKYSFSASDGSDNAIGTPTTERNFNVTSSNTAPQLTWTSEPNYISDGVDPDSNVGGATFTFRVKYIDSDNDAPSLIQVWVDKNDDDDYLDTGEQLDLTAVDSGDTDYTDGKLYTTDVVIAAAGDGRMNYRFHASDSAVDAIGTPTADSFVTIIIDAIKVSCPGIGDYDYTSLQDAIDNAMNGDTILVADGTCTETITIDNKILTITSVNGAASTILDAASSGRAVTLTNGADTTFDGLTFQNGTGGAGYGGGFTISNSSPFITNSIVTANTSARAGGIYLSTSDSTVTISNSTLSANTSTYNGGALYLESGASAMISNTTFHDNSVSGGNGAAVFMTSSADASLTITGSTFTKNTAVYGGAIYGSSSGGTVTISIDDSIFTASDTTDAGTIAATKNYSTNRGGVLYLTDGGGTFNFFFSDSTIQYGTTQFEGGAMYLNNLDATTITGSTFADNFSTTSAGFLKYGNTGGNSISITDSVIRDNSAAGNHGAMYMAGGTITFDRCSITGNSVSDRGGAGTISGSAGSPTVTTIQNSIITGNKTTNYEGGGFWLTDDGYSSHTVNIINSTFSGNYAGTFGGGINRTATASVTIKNSIFWENGATSNSEINGTVTASYSVIGQNGYTGSNNLDTNPLFVNRISASSAPTSSGDYHLQLSSPAIDAGTSTGAPVDDFDSNLRPLGNGVDMGADEVITMANTAPVLSWTGETNYSNDGVDPDLDISGSNFVFRINYADADNNAPSSIQAWIDKNDDGDYLDGSEKIDLTEVDGGDTTYSDGKLYTTTESLTYSGDGVLNYRFYAADSYEIASGEPVSAKTVTINTAPSLDWVGSGGYTTDGVDPDSAASGSNFEFRIKYTDANNDGPTAIQVWVDKNDDNDYLDAGEKLTMNGFDPGDSNYTDGKVYYRTIALDYTGDGVFNYRFYGSDGQVATGDPTIMDKEVTVQNNAPVLSWIGSGNFTTDGVHPDNAVGGASYEFQITYTDADNNGPTSIQVWVDKNDDNDYLDTDEKIDMEPVDGDSDYTDGKNYTKTMTLDYAGSGDGYQNYRFYASDGIDDATGTPTTNSGVGVFETNNAPDLDWTGEENYTTDGVHPDSGAVNDTFTFRVEYTDIENTAPSSIQVWVDLNDDGDSIGEEGTELFSMDVVDAGDTTYDNGKLYTKDVVVSSGGDGTLLYNFLASDGTDDATGNATANKTIDVVVPIEVCGVNNPATCEFTSIQSAINAALSTPPCDTRNFIKVCDGTYNENINYNGKDITLYSENGAASTFITGTGANAPVVTVSSSETSGAVLDGFTIDNAGNNTLTRGIYISGATPIIKNSIIEGNDAPNATGGGGGIYINNSAPTFDTCTIRDNTTLNRAAGGIYITGAAGGATIYNSTIGGESTADRNYSNNGRAGGIYFENSSTGTLTITNSAIKYNECAQDGAGLYLTGITNETVITGSFFSNNSAGGYGGGLYASNAPVRIVNSHIDNNTIASIRNGSGIYMTGVSSSLVIEGNSTVSNNNTTAVRAAYGAAVYITGSTAPTPLSISDTVIDNNHSQYGGGAIYMSSLSNTSSFTNVTISNNSNSGGHGGGIMAVSAPLTVTGNTITGNSAPTTKNGGGLYVETTTATVTSTTFSGNSAGIGGGLAVGGTTPTLNLEKVKVQGNSAPNGGGGINIGSGTATITNCLITGNNVDSDYRYGGGIANSGTLNLYNSTVAGNYVLRDGGGIQAGGTETIRNSIIFGNIADLGTLDAIRSTAETVEYSDVEGGYTGDGNIDTDPLFADFQQAGQGAPESTGDFKLMTDSACIDTASATNAPADDIDGNPRPTDISGKGDGVDDYDMGAYEYVE